MEGEHSTLLSHETLRLIVDPPHETWNEVVTESPQGTVFHRMEFIQTIADIGQADLHRLLAVSASDPDRWIGFLPVFVVSRGPLRMAFSPPPNLGIPFLGPGFHDDFDGAGGFTFDHHGAFTDLCHRWIRREVDPSYVHVRTDWRYRDLGPFVRDGTYSITPRFTFLVDLQPGPEALIEGFSRDARQNVRKTPEDRYEINVGGRRTLERIIEQIQRRYEEQDKPCPMTVPFVRRLYDRLPRGALRPYGCWVDGEFVSGLLVLDGSERVYRWQGGTKVDVDVPVNDLLDWQVMVDAAGRGRRWYDLVGANVPRLSAYKAKFNPTLVPYHVIERGSRGMTLMVELYRRFSSVRRYVRSHQIANR